MTDTFEESTVSIEIGLKPELLVFENVKLTKLKIDPQVGGLTELTLTVQCKLEEEAASVFQWMNHSADVEIVVGARAKTADAQPELPLNSFGADEKPPAAAAEKPKRGRPPRARGADAVN